MPQVEGAIQLCHISQAKPLSLSTISGTSTVVQWLRICLQCRDVGSNPGQGTKITSRGWGGGGQLSLISAFKDALVLQGRPITVKIINFKKIPVFGEENREMCQQII